MDWLICIHIVCIHIVCIHTICIHTICIHTICIHTICVHTICIHTMYTCYIHAICIHTICIHTICIHTICIHTICIVCTHIVCTHIVCIPSIHKVSMFTYSMYAYNPCGYPVHSPNVFNDVYCVFQPDFIPHWPENRSWGLSLSCIAIAHLQDNKVTQPMGVMMLSVWLYCLWFMSRWQSRHGSLYLFRRSSRFLHKGSVCTDRIKMKMAFQHSSRWHRSDIDGLCFVGTWPVCNSAYLSSCSAVPLLAFRHAMWHACIYCRLCMVKGPLHTDWVTDWVLLCCTTCVAYECRKILSCFDCCARSRPMLVLHSLSFSFHCFSSLSSLLP